MRGDLRVKLLMCGAFLLLCAPVFAETIVFDTELMSMNMAGDTVMPLGPNWGNISTRITFTESSGLSSMGQTTAIGLNQAGQYQVESFFDVFFDVTVKDIDGNLNFPGMADSSSLYFTDNGPTHLTNTYSAIFDQAAPDYGLFPPPEASPYIGFVNFVIPLGADLNGNGENDVIKFALGALTFLDSNRTFILLPDGTVINNFDSTLSMDGGVMDLSSDPPFGPITLTGPTTARSQLQENPTVPEPASLVLLVSGLLGLAGLRRKLTK